MRDKIKTYLPIIVFGAILLLAFIVTSIMVQSNNARLAQSNQELAELSNQRDTLVSDNAKKTQEVIEATTGLDLKRQEHDDKIVADIFKTAFTWDSSETYNAARDKMLNEYKFGSKFVDDLMPEVPTMDTATGKINEIDAYGLNLKYAGHDSYVVKISGSDYSYITEVYIDSENKAGGTARGRILMMYNVGINGKVTNIDGTTLQR